MQPTTDSNQTSQSYTFNVSLGAVNIKNQGTLEKDLENLDNITRYLDRPDLDEPISFYAKIEQIQSKLSTRMQRLWNLLFGDHQWYKRF